MKTAPLFSINLKDLGKGLLIAVLSAVLGAIYTTLQAGSLSFDWKQIGTLALSSLVAYLMKNFFTNSNNELAKSEPPKAS